MVRLVKQQVWVLTVQRTLRRVKGRPVGQSRDLTSLTSKKGLEDLRLFSQEEFQGKCSELLQRRAEQTDLQLHAKKHRKEWT